MPWAFKKEAFKKDTFFPRCIADGVIGYSAEGIANTWKVLTKLCSHDLSKMVDKVGTDLICSPCSPSWKDHGRKVAAHL